MLSLLEYHAATRHSLESVQSSTFQFDWANQPLPFKIYTTLAPSPLSTTFSATSMAALSAIAGSSGGSARLDRQMLARLCYFSNGVTRVRRRRPFRAAACTGALYHIELYLICSELEDLEAGVYHYAAHDKTPSNCRDMARVVTTSTTRIQ